MNRSSRASRAVRDRSSVARARARSTALLRAHLDFEPVRIYVVHVLRHRQRIVVIVEINIRQGIRHRIRLRASFEVRRVRLAHVHIRARGGHRPPGDVTVSRLAVARALSRSTPSLCHVLRRIRKRLQDSWRLRRILILIQATRAAPSVARSAARAARSRAIITRTSSSTSSVSRPAPPRACSQCSKAPPVHPRAPTPDSASLHPHPRALARQSPAVSTRSRISNHPPPTRRSRTLLGTVRHISSTGRVFVHFRPFTRVSRACDARAASVSRAGGTTAGVPLEIVATPSRRAFASRGVENARARRRRGRWSRARASHRVRADVRRARVDERDAMCGGGENVCSGRSPRVT